MERFDGNRSVGKSKGSRIDDDRKLFLICVSRVAVSLVKKDSSRHFFFFFFFFRGTFKRLSSLSEPILRGHFLRPICWEFFSNLLLVLSVASIEY